MLGEGDVESCEDCRSVEPLEFGAEVVERVFQRRFEKVVDINGVQVGFMVGGGIGDAIFIIRQAIEW